MKFKVDDIVEQTNLGDLPFFVTAVQKGPVNRYELSGIDGSTYSNIPEYMMKPARPPSESKWGTKASASA